MKLFKPGAAAVAIAAALVTQPAFGQVAVDHIVFTENSSTSLTAAYTDYLGNVTPLTPNNIGPDQWTVGGFPSDVIFSGFTFYWAEPEDSGLANRVLFGGDTLGKGLVTITSDVPIPADTILLANGQTSDTPVGNDLVSISQTTFFDQAAASETTRVPDAGSTAMLLGIGMAGIGWLRRTIPAQRCPHPAFA